MKNDLAGQQFGRLTAREIAGRANGGHLVWLCDCACGSTSTVRADHLRQMRVLSCGCLNAEMRTARIVTLTTTHGDTHSAEFRAWLAMLDRCRNPNSRSYRNYGGRGIRVSDRWNPAAGGSYENFLSDMGRRPEGGRSLDRIDNDGDYSPANCRWATASEQIHNRRPVTQWKNSPGPKPRSR